MEVAKEGNRSMALFSNISSNWEVLSSSNSMTAFLIVSLVASSTVCLLINGLILLLLYQSKSGVQLCFRYRVMRSQAILGLLSSTLVLFPLLKLNISRSHWTTSKSFDGTHNVTFDALHILNSNLLTQIPSTALATSMVLHCSLMYLEQTIYAFSVGLYSKMVSDTRISRLLIGFVLWMLPLTLALLHFLQASICQRENLNLARGVFNISIGGLCLGLQIILLLKEKIIRKKNQNKRLVSSKKLSENKCSAFGDGSKTEKKRKVTSVIVLQSAYSSQDDSFGGGLHSKNGLPINLERSVFNARSSGLFLVSITTVLNSWQALPFIDFTGNDNESAIMVLSILTSASIVPIVHILFDGSMTALGSGLLNSVTRFVSRDEKKKKKNSPSSHKLDLQDSESENESELSPKRESV